MEASTQCLRCRTPAWPRLKQCNDCLLLASRDPTADRMMGLGGRRHAGRLRGDKARDQHRKVDRNRDRSGMILQQ